MKLIEKCPVTHLCAEACISDEIINVQMTSCLYIKYVNVQFAFTNTSFIKVTFLGNLLFFIQFERFLFREKLQLSNFLSIGETLLHWLQ